MGSTNRRRTFLIGLVVFLSLGVSLGSAGPIGTTASAYTVRPAIALRSGKTLVRVAPRPRLPRRSTNLGSLSSDTSVSGAVALKPQYPTRLANLITEMSNPHSLWFHHYLSRVQFRQLFGPSKTTVSAAVSALRSNGLHVSGVSSNGLMVYFHGHASRVQSTFHTHISRYRFAGGRHGYATTSAIKLPSAVAAHVATVIGLNNVVHVQSGAALTGTHSAAGASAGSATSFVRSAVSGPKACTDATNDASQYGGLTDAAIANAYGATGLYKAGDVGAGQTIAVYEVEPFLRSDIKTFDACFFGGPRANAMVSRLHTIPVDGGQPVGAGSGESALDIEDVSAVAPGATIDVYTAPNSTFGTIDEYNAIVSADKAQIVTSSWGLCELAVQTGEPGIQQEENYLFQEAAAQGMSMFASSGDSGSSDCSDSGSSQPVDPVLSVDDPASNPYVVAVGGTSMYDAKPAPLERVWNNGAGGGAGGGGISQSWVASSWQQGPLVPGIHGAAGAGAVLQAEKVMKNTFCGAKSLCRQVPDVSAQADQDTGGITVYSASPEIGGWTVIGGTSSSAPLWAAMTALVNASPTCAGNSGTAHGVGFLSPLLYGVASVPAMYKASFNDITKGNNDSYAIDGHKVFPAAKGFDMASGLGSPQLTSPTGGHGLAYYLCRLGASSTRPVVSSLSPSFGPTSGGTAVTVTGNGFGVGSGATFKPQVSGLHVGRVFVPTAKLSIVGATTLRFVLPNAAKQISPKSAVDGAGPVVVAVTLTDGQTSRIGPGSTFGYVDENQTGTVPAVSAVTAYGGSESGGSKVSILGSGFSTTGTRKVTSVTFGGVPATTYRVLTSSVIRATVPPYSAGGSVPTHCSTALKPSTDLCQVQVVVSNAGGSSRTEKILPAFEGDVSAFNPDGVLVAPAGCGCEIAPQGSEYDYTPSPRVTSISTNVKPADENGGSAITIKGRGFNPATFIGVYFGKPGPNGFTEDQLDYNLINLTGTAIRIIAPPQPATAGAVKVPVTVWTLAGLSKASPPATDATYAGTG